MEDPETTTHLHNHHPETRVETTEKEPQRL